MAQVRFEVRHEFSSSSEAVWTRLVDWATHGDWIPATKVDGPDGEPTAPGTEFTATTGYGPLALVDRMRVVRCDWDDASASGDCEVEKIGPVLTGRAAFTVLPHGTGTASGAVVNWLEDIRVPYLPQFLSPLASIPGSLGFRYSMRRLAKLVARESNQQMTGAPADTNAD